MAQAASSKAPAPAPEDGTTAPVEPDLTYVEEAAPEDPARYFVGVSGITDGMTHYGTGDYFVGSETLLDHFRRSGGKDRTRVLYREVSEREWAAAEDARLAAIQDVELLPEPLAMNQVVPNQFTENSFLAEPLAAPGAAPIGAQPGGAGFTALDGGMAGSS